jgi:hypothetical protein
MSVAHCLPLPSSDPRIRWIVVVILVLVASGSSRVSELLGLAASAVAVLGLYPSRKSPDTAT